MSKYTALSLIVLSLTFYAIACEPIKQPKDIEKLDIVLLGTYGYATYEELGRTIEDYDAQLMYDEGRLPDTQVGFPLTVPIAFFNQGKQSWYDPRAELLIRVTAPNGVETNLTLLFKDAFVQRRRATTSGQYVVKDKAMPIERRIYPDARRVFFFETTYLPTMSGVYTVFVELRSKSLTGLRITRSGFGLYVVEPTVGVAVIL